MTDSQTQLLEREMVLPRIFVDNDALAFFDVDNVTHELVDVAEIKDNPMKKLYNRPYNFLVDKNRECYFRIDDYKNPLRTVSVTSYCIIFGAYSIDDDEEIKCSGVYHAESLPPKDSFRYKIHKLIDTIRSTQDEEIMVKAAGNDSKGEKLKQIRNGVIKVLAEKNVEIDSKYLILGGDKTYRTTEFYPLTGKLITHFSGKKNIL